MPSERTSQLPPPAGSGVAVFRTVEVGPSEPPAPPVDAAAAASPSTPPAPDGKRGKGKGLRPVVSSSSVPLDRAETEGYRSSNRVDSARVVFEGAVPLIKSSPHFDPPKASVVLREASHEPTAARMTLPGLRRSPLAPGKPWMLVGAAGVAVAFGAAVGGALMLASPAREAASATRGDAVMATERDDRGDASPPVNAAEVVGQAGIRRDEGATVEAGALPDARGGKARHGAPLAAKPTATGAKVDGRAILANGTGAEPTSRSVPPAPAAVDLSEAVPTAHVVLEEEPEGAPAPTGAAKRELVRDAPF